jgi:hypothetical protein
MKAGPSQSKNITIGCALSALTFSAGDTLECIRMPSPGRLPPIDG